MWGMNLFRPNHWYAGRRLPGAALLSLMMLLAPLASAQDASAEEVLANFTAVADAASDASMLVLGELRNTDGSRYPIEIEVEIIPGEGVARLYILQPDAMADNFIVLTPEMTYSYNYMTNQIVLYDADDAAAFGGLVGDLEEGQTFTLTLDLAELFDGWEKSLQGYAEGTYTLRFTNLDPGALIRQASLQVSEDTWLPGRIAVYGDSGEELLFLHLREVALDQGLQPADLIWYPGDAEVIDERD